MRKAVRWIGVGTLLTLLALFAFYYRLSQTVFLSAGESCQLDFYPGTLPQQLSLSHRKLKPAWRRYLWLHGSNAHLKSGRYQFKGPMTLGELRDDLEEGAGRVLVSWTVLPGTTWQQTDAELKVNRLFAYPPKGIVLEGISASLEGHLWPETYSAALGTSAHVLVAKAYQAFQTNLQKQWVLRASHLPYKTPEEAVVLASIIEKEASNRPEIMPSVAGVFVRRLKQGMRLQSDATVFYAASLAHQKTDFHINSPFNTYRHRGLPPHPIAFPSEKALQASLHPDMKDKSLYFVAYKDKEPVFSQTFSKHRQAIAKHHRKAAKGKRHARKTH